MITRRGLLGAAFAAAMLLPAVGSASSTACQASLDVLISMTAAAEFSGRNAEKDEAGLIAKLQNAKSKLDQWKGVDALQKLDDYSRDVSKLIAGPKSKLSWTDGTALLDEAEYARACIERLME